MLNNDPITVDSSIWIGGAVLIVQYFLQLHLLWLAHCSRSWLVSRIVSKLSKRGEEPIILSFYASEPQLVNRFAEQFSFQP